MARYDVRYQVRKKGSNLWSFGTMVLELGEPDIQMAENNVKARVGSSAEEIRILDIKEKR